MPILTLKIKGVGEVPVEKPQSPFCPAEGCRPTGGKTIAALHNNYGGGIRDCAKKYGIDPAAALAVMFTEAGCVGAYDGGTELAVIRVEARSPILSRTRFPNGGREFTTKYGSGQQAEWKALADWCEKEGERALSYTSFGLAQVMGFNFEHLNLKRPLEVLKAAQRSAADQVEMFFKFVKFNGMVSNINRREWQTVAKKYNGPGQVAFYAGHLDSNYQRAKALIGGK